MEPSVVLVVPARSIFGSFDLKGLCALKTLSFEPCDSESDASSTAGFVERWLAAGPPTALEDESSDDVFASRTGTATRPATSASATGQRRFARRSCQRSSRKT